MPQLFLGGVKKGFRIWSWLQKPWIILVLWTCSNCLRTFACFPHIKCLPSPWPLSLAHPICQEASWAGITGLGDHSTWALSHDTFTQCFHCLFLHISLTRLYCSLVRVLDLHTGYCGLPLHVLGTQHNYGQREGAQEEHTMCSFGDKVFHPPREMRQHGLEVKGAWEGSALPFQSIRMGVILPTSYSPHQTKFHANNACENLLPSSSYRRRWYTKMEMGKIRNNIYLETD